MQRFAFGLVFVIYVLVTFSFLASGQDDRRGFIGIEYEYEEEDSGDVGLRTSNNLRPCRGYNQTDTNGNETYFMSRCDTYAPEENCSVAWELFSSVWNGTTFYDPNNPPDYTAFIEYFNWKAYMQENGYQPIFYAGSGQCPDIVHRLTNVTNIPLITLEDQNGPYSVANAGWCGSDYFNGGSCASNTTWGHAPNGNLFPGYNNYSGAAFWGPASHHFGKSAFGTVWALVRSFERGTTPAPAFGTGIFPDVELPTVLSQPDVTAFKVVVVSNSNQPAETCGNGTLVTMVNRIKMNVTNVECIVDPPCLLQFFCDVNLPNYYAVPINNKDQKCAYYNALVSSSSLDVTINCNCSMDHVSFTGGQWVSDSVYCPQVGGVTTTGGSTTGQVTTTGSESTTSEPATTGSYGNKNVESWIIIGVTMVVGLLIA